MGLISRVSSRTYRYFFLKKNMALQKFITKLIKLRLDQNKIKNYAIIAGASLILGVTVVAIHNYRKNQKENENNEFKDNFSKVLNEIFRRESIKNQEFLSQELPESENESYQDQDQEIETSTVINSFEELRLNFKRSTSAETNETSTTLTVIPNYHDRLYNYIATPLPETPRKTTNVDLQPLQRWQSNIETDTEDEFATPAMSEIAESEVSDLEVTIVERNFRKGEDDGDLEIASSKIGRGDFIKN